MDTDTGYIIRPKIHNYIHTSLYSIDYGIITIYTIFRGTIYHFIRLDDNIVSTLIS